MSTGLTSGVTSFDEVIDDVRVGDNLVVVGRGSAETAWIAEHFVDARDDRALVVFSDDTAWDAPPRGVRVVDWSSLDGVHEARDALTAADLEVGGDALFLFDGLTDVQESWGAEAALDLFLWACPRLYRRRSVALWLLDGDRHRPGFLRRLVEVTQVVVEVTGDANRLTLTTVKADGRPASTVGREVALDARTLQRVGSRDTRPEALGSRVRRLRTERDLAQAELARQVGISPSALSQLERGVRSVSADTITRIWEVLGVPFGPGRDRPSGHRIIRRTAQPPPESARGLTRHRLSTDPDTGELWRVTIDPGATGRSAPFPVKTSEVVTVLEGIVDLELGGHPTTLHEGDTLTTTTTAVTGWGNPGTTACELLWVVLPSRDR